MSKEAMKQALEALEDHGHAWVRHERQYVDAMLALRQAIAEAEKQEPVAWYYWKTNQAFTLEPPPSLKAQCEPLYTHPQPKRKPLTDEQIEELWHEDTSCDMPDELKQFKHTARAIEAAHGIKGEA